MLISPWHRRFLATTRGRVVALLRREPHTVDELARALQLTDNAVRAQLAALERDALVQQSGVRRGGGSGKPAYAYVLAPDGEQLFPKAYALILRCMLDIVSEHASPEEMTTMLLEVGRRIATDRAIVGMGTQPRLSEGVRVLEELGGAAAIVTHDGVTEIQCTTCPLAAVVPNHPDVCHLAEALLSTAIGQPVQEHCDRGESPHCRFEVTMN